MGKNAIGYQIFCINSSVFTSPNNISQSNSAYTNYLTDNSNRKPDKHSKYWICENFRRRYKKQQIKNWEQPVAIMVNYISYFNHYFMYYFIATMPQKLYHLKNVSTFLKPVFSNSSIFSDNLYGINIFSKASLFCAISISS